MVPLTSLWLPILLSAVFVFVLSSIVHMVLGYHAADFKRLPVANEDELMATMRRLNVAPGDYLVPCPASPRDMKNPAYLERRMKGPAVTMTVTAGGPIKMGKPLGQWFLFTVLISIFAAYVAGRALPAGTPYLQVFRFAGTAAFLSYAMGDWPHSIWYRRSWATTLRNTFDALLYAGVTAGTLGWLWPR